MTPAKQPSPAQSELVTACRRLYRAIDRLDAKAASTAGVSRSDLRCLNLLAEAPAKPGQIATDRLAELHAGRAALRQNCN